MKKNKDWKVEALKFEYCPVSGVEDSYWDKNFTKNMIRDDVMWLINKIYELEKELKEARHDVANLTK